MTNYPAIAMFFIFVFATLMITYWAAKKQNQDLIFMQLEEK